MEGEKRKGMVFVEAEGGMERKKKEQKNLHKKQVENERGKK